MRWRTSLCIALLLLLASTMIYAESLPKGWEIWPWELEATAEFQRDVENKYQGNSALCIKKPTGTIALVLPAIGLTPGQSYVFKGWLRTELEIGQEAHLAVALYDANGNYLEEVQSRGITGQTDWNQLRVEIKSENAAKAALFCRVWGGGDGTVWFDELGMEELKPFRRVQIPAGGFELEDFVIKAQPLRVQPNIFNHRLHVWTEIKRTPESNWQGTDRARIDLSTNFDTGPSAWLQLYGVDDTTNFYNQRNMTVNFGIRTFELRDRFIYQDATLNWVLGRLWLDYSPFILTLTDDERGRYTIRHGALVDNIPFAKGALACFIFPDGQNFAWGSRYRLTSGAATMNTTLFNRQKALELVERDFAYFLTYKLKKGAVSFDLAQQIQEPSKDAKAMLVAYESNIDSLTYRLCYFNFASDFDPPYRDRMPQYSSVSRSLTRWNVVERYQGKQGYGLTINCKEKLLGGTVELDSWQEVAGQKYRLAGSATSTFLKFKVDASILSKGHQLVNPYGVKQYFQDYLRIGGSLRKDFKLPLPLVSGISSEIEKFQGITCTINDLFGEYSVASGYLKGLRLKLGWEHNSALAKPRAYVETKWTLPNRVNLYYRHYTSSIQEQAPHFDLVRERYLDYDNLLLISFSASFSR